MDVTCNRCGTVYEFDAGLVAPSGTTVKCIECGHLFKVHRPGAAPLTSDEAPNRQRSWRVRQVDGTSRVVESLAEVLRLIGAGQFGPEDEISRTGQVWKRLGSIAELSPMFSAPQRSVTHAEPQVPRERRRSPRELDLSAVPPSARPRRPSPIVELNTKTRRDIAPPEPGPTEQRSSVTPLASPMQLPLPARDRVAPRTSRHYLGLLSIAGALFITGSVAAVVLSPSRQRDGAQVELRIQQLLQNADRALAMHRPSGFDLAIREYESALQLDPDSALALSGLSRAHAIWSQWLRARLGPPHRSHTQLASEVDELRSQARRHTDAAQRYAQRAVQLVPARGSVGIAWSDALRLSGDLAAARAALDHARAEPDAAGLQQHRAEALRVAALLAIDESGGDPSAGRSLAEQAVDAEPSLLRMRFLLLHCLIGSSALDAARAQLRSLQQLDPTHPSLPSLAAQIEAADQPQHGHKPHDSAPWGGGAIVPTPESSGTTGAPTGRWVPTGPTAHAALPVAQRVTRL